MAAPKTKLAAAKQPAAKQPAAKQPAAKQPAAKQPAAKQPAAKQPAAKQPAAKQPAAKQPAAKQPAEKGAKIIPGPPKAWLAIVDTLLPNPGISRRRVFSADGLRLVDKFFAMSWRDSVIAKLPRARVDALVAKGMGSHFDPGGKGRPMREWLVIPPEHARRWAPLVEEALGYVGSLQR